jgi:aminomethyltransferase
VKAEMENVSDDIHYWRFKGLKQLKRCKLSSVDLAAIKYYHFEVADFAGLDVIISATGYTGSGGFEIYCKNADVEQIWNKVFEAAYGIKPIGLAARDTCV